VSYQEAGDEYFLKRRLRRHAAFWSLWSLGVAAVISGDFYGWNLGLDAGGFAAC
jgi:ethanolamine permease